MMITSTTGTKKTNMSTMTTRADVQQQLAQDKHAAGAAVWRERHFRAMNTSIHLNYYGENSQLGQYVESFFEQNEQRLSRFRPSSELSRLNECGETTCRVSSELFSILEAAKWANQATEGLFDPAVLDDLERVGYDHSFELIDRANTLMEGTNISNTKGVNVDWGTQRRMDIQDVKLYRAALQVSRPTRLRLDLGGIGKGWTVDRCSDFLHVQGPFLLNAGGDLYAYGAPGGTSGWEIEIEDARDPERSIATLVVSNAAVTTSTTVKRSWWRDGIHMHHIIDPRTGLPAATDLLAVTVVAPRATMAEIYAKSALILGSRSGLAFLSGRGVDGMLQLTDGTVLTTQGIVRHMTLLA